jgi:hypothetical protein
VNRCRTAPEQPALAQDWAPGTNPLVEKQWALLERMARAPPGQEQERRRAVALAPG